MGTRPSSNSSSAAASSARFVLRVWFTNTLMTLKATAASTNGAYGLVAAGRPAESDGLSAAGPVDVGLLTRVGDDFEVEILGPPMQPLGI